jgi:hypothetical protein
LVRRLSHTLRGIHGPGAHLAARGHPEPIRLAFFAANVSGVSLTAYLLLQYFVRERDYEHARSERLLLNVLPAPISAGSSATRA